MILAQLVQPSSQTGPARLPSSRQIPTEQQNTVEIKIDTKDKSKDGPKASDNDSTQPGEDEANQTIITIDKLPYNPAEIVQILGPCSKIESIADKLKACAEQLSKQLIIDGYINTRILIQSQKQPYKLAVLPGRLVEIRVFGDNKALNEKITKQLEPLKSGFFNLVELQVALDSLEKRRDVDSLRAQLTRHGSQVNLSALKIQVVANIPAWESFVSISNDGAETLGELKTEAITQKEDLIQGGDIFLAFLQFNKTKELNLGSFNQSVSYTYPISQQINLSGALGFGINKISPNENNKFNLRYNQFQAIANLDWLIHQNKNSNLSVFSSLIGSRSNLYINDKTPSRSTASNLVSRPTMAYLRFGVNANGVQNKLAWQAQFYGLQGLPGFVPSNQRKEHVETGVNLGEAQAIAAQTMLRYRVNNRLNLLLSGSAQLAFRPLPHAMNFAVGSDQGLIGLPANLFSGNSGVLSTIEAPFMLTRSDQHQFEVVPFGGIGYAQTKTSSISTEQEAASYGALLRYTMKKPNLVFELGYTRPLLFSAHSNSGWRQTLMGQGLYTRASYTF